MDHRSFSGERYFNNMAISIVTYKPILVMKRPPFYYICPCLIAAAPCLIGLVSSLVNMKSSQGRNWIFVSIFGPALFVFLVADLIVKLVVTKRVLYIWLIELVVVALTVWAFKSYFFFL